MIEAWHLWCIFGVMLFIFELFFPLFFFLNLAMAAFPAAAVAYFGVDSPYQVLAFAAFAAIFVMWLRPVFLKNQKEKEDLFKSKYLGQHAKTLEDITLESGRISVFDEEWEARACYAAEELPKGRTVEIKKVKDLVMYVDNIIDHSKLDYKILSTDGPAPSNGLVEERESLD